MTNVCKLVLYCFVIIMHEDEIEPNAATTLTSLTLETFTNDTNASTATTLSTSEISIKPPSSLITTQIMSDILSVFLFSSTTTESTSESTNALYSKSCVTTLKSEADVFSFNESFMPISMMLKTSSISLSASNTITSLTADTSDITSSASVTATSTSEATSVYPSMPFLETSLASESANVYSSISITTKLGKTTISLPESISRTASTSETMSISPSISILKSYQTYDTNNVSFTEIFTTVYESTVLIPSETKTTKATSTSHAISPSSESTTASSSQTIALSPSFSATLYASNFQPTTSLSASISASSTYAHTATYSSASFIATTSKTESTAMSSSTFRTTTAASEQTTTSKKLFTVDLGGINLDLRFSIKVNKTFIEAYNIKGSSEFKELAKLFADMLTQIYNNTVGFKYIDVREFRKGSVEAVYYVIISALVNLTEVKVYITGTVFNQLRALKINDSQVDETFLNETLSNYSASSKSKCDLAAQRLCPFGYICEDLTQTSVLCSDKCNNQKCEYGSCYIDHQDESVLKCRCPIDDDGYVYTGDRCEHKSLSTLIIITSGVGGGVLAAAFFIICVICIKMRRKQEESDDHPVDSIPDYSKYFSLASIYQPMYGYNLAFGRGTRNGSVNLGGKSGYFLSNGNVHENMNYINDDLDRHFGDNTSQLKREEESFEFIEMDTKFEIRRPNVR